MQEMRAQSLAQEDLLKEGMATHPNIPAWRIPWTEKPGGLQSTGLQRARHDWSNLACMHAKDFYSQVFVIKWIWVWIPNLSLAFCITLSNVFTMNPSVNFCIWKVGFNDYTSECYSNLKKKKILTPLLQLEGPWGCYAKWTKSERGGQILRELIYMWNLKKKTLQTPKLIEKGIRFVISREWGRKWGRNWIQVIKRYKIPALG